MSSTTYAKDNANTGRWSKEEHAIFMEGLRTHGKEWKTIAQMVETRTVVQIRTHAQKYFQKLAKLGVTDPIADITSGSLRQKLTGSKRRRGGNTSRKAGSRAARSPRNRVRSVSSVSASSLDAPVTLASNDKDAVMMGESLTGVSAHAGHSSQPKTDLVSSADSLASPDYLHHDVFPGALGGHSLMAASLSDNEDDVEMAQTAAFAMIPSLSELGASREYGLDPLSEPMPFEAPPAVTSSLLQFPSVPDDGRVSPVAPLADLMQTNPLDDGWLSDGSCDTSESIDSAESVEHPNKRRRLDMPSYSLSTNEFDEDSFFTSLMAHQ